MGKLPTGYKKQRKTKNKDNKDQIGHDLRNLPRELDFESCLKIYGLLNAKCDQHCVPSPKVKNCRMNPYCIHRVGNEKWEKFKRGTVDQQAPQMTKRDVKQQPCGLSNFGNFCYVNSFLQIWFNDLSFRQIVYKWKSDPEWSLVEGTKLDIQAVMNCLQELFLTMQITPYEFTNALEFISLLKLDNEQHDVQEFTILFFDALDRHLQTHPNGEAVRKAIRSRYEGKNRQIISCSCGNRSIKEDMFMSLTLTIDGCNTLAKALDGYYTPEELSDYKCSGCGKSGNTSRSNETVKLPPVLLLQLNRYTYDQYGRNKKIMTPVQYPRELYSADLRYDSEEPSIKYDLTAVMIHEGTSANCGHYYDLIKDPNTDKWFIYNDKEVSITKTPGVNPEKGLASKGTTDMKGCYALIYRVEDETLLNLDSDNVPKTVDDLELPDAEIFDRVQTKLNDTFQKESRDGDRSYELWQKCINEKHEFLERLWVSMEVENGDVVRKRPSSVVFLPTALLSEIHAKEFKSIENMKDLAQLVENQFLIKNGIEKLPSPSDADIINEAIKVIGDTSMDETEDEQFDERFQEIAEQLAEEKTAAIKRERIRTNSNASLSDEETIKMLYITEQLNDIRMPVCPHGRISVDSVLKGEVKAVNKEPAVRMLQAYNICVKPSDGRTFGMDEHGLLTGADLCIPCITLMRKEYSWKESVESNIELVNQILARVNQPPPPGSCYVSKKQLQSYRKLVVQEMNYQKSLAPKETVDLIFKVDHVENSEPVKKKRRYNTDEEIPSTQMEKASISSVDTKTDFPEDVEIDDIPNGNEKETDEPMKPQENKETQQDLTHEDMQVDIERDKNNPVLSKNGVGNSGELKNEIKMENHDEIKMENHDEEEHSECENICGNGNSGLKLEKCNGNALKEKNKDAEGGKNTFKNNLDLAKNGMVPEEFMENSQEVEEIVKREDLLDSNGRCEENRPCGLTDRESVGEKLSFESKKSEFDETAENIKPAQDMDRNSHETSEGRKTSVSDEEFSPPTKPEDPDDPEIEVIGEVIRTPVKPVVFNDDLICPHNQFKRQRMTWMYQEEWDLLVQSNFSESRHIPVDQEECVNCCTQQEEASQRRNQIQSQINSITTSLRKVFSNAEKRTLIDVNPTYERVLCAKYIHHLKAMAKAKNPQILPEMCQKCLLCKEHQKPFFRNHDNHDPDLMDEVLCEISGQRTLRSYNVTLPSSSTDFPPVVTGVPITKEEWNTIKATVEKYGNAEPKEIRLENGDFTEFCDECSTKAIEMIRLQKCTYPMGADVYVKLKQDEEDDQQRSNRSGTLTRRGANKNLVKIKMRSVDTIKKLKLELYKRTNQTPADQLLYWKETELLNDMTLCDAGIEARNIDNPIILITQQHTELTDTPRPLEKGFKDTALSSA
ncbi:unnamed protein product [Bursaphelenchus okinawaensis]|uniref:ubiquitinyl hydrolase 1 n=1 Tax=Bursaphelenchus okinawaensis TaxID=465554 RepID=A0A811JWG2_9BILA|nr:unnamed protein product [Bursaphelenchus okinawaensis]CAG9086739.1 unnamed protein product [Bursaphelenchus okinawaensis]